MKRERCPSMLMFDDEAAVMVSWKSGRLNCVE